MLKAYKYRIYPSDQDKELLSKHFGCRRFVYNLALQLSDGYYEVTGKTFSEYDISNEIVNLKSNPEYAWLKEVNSQIIQAAVKDFVTARYRFFKKISSRPVLKSKYKSRRSFRLPQHFSLDYDHNLLHLPKFKKPIKAKFSRRIDGKIKFCTVSCNKAGQYFVSVTFEDYLPKPKKVVPDHSEIIGVDVGLHNFAVFSTGEVIPNPNFLKTKRTKVARANRKLHRSKKGSNGRKKARLQLARAHQRVVDQRKDFQHKLSTRLVSENRAVAREDLNVKGMLKNHKLAKAISDASWSSFDQMTFYKAERAGKHFIKIDRFRPSSKQCSVCGNINKKLKLKTREWTCKGCGVEHDRDLNAAVNIKNFAYTDLLEQLELSVPRDAGEVMPDRTWIALQSKSDGAGSLAAGPEQESLSL